MILYDIVLYIDLVYIEIIRRLEKLVLYEALLPGLS